MDTFIGSKYFEVKNKINLIRNDIENSDIPQELSHLTPILFSMLANLNDYLNTVHPKLRNIEYYFKEILSDLFILEHNLSVFEQIYWPVLKKYNRDEKIFFKILDSIIKKIDCLQEKNITEKLAIATFQNQGYATLSKDPIHVFYFPYFEKFTLLNFPLLYHEIGHNIIGYTHFKNILVSRFKTQLADYKNSQLQMMNARNTKKFHQKFLSQVVRSWEKWTNEIICDIIGTILTGPAFVYAITKLFISSGDDPFDFKVHPLYPSNDIRVSVCLKTLKKMKDFKRDYDYLNKLWKSYLSKRDVNPGNDYNNFFNDVLINAIIDSVIEGAKEISLAFYRINNISDENLSKEALLKYFETLLNICWKKYLQDTKNYFNFEKNILSQLKMTYSS